jgi:hypothetical protein
VCWRGGVCFGGLFSDCPAGSSQKQRTQAKQENKQERRCVTFGKSRLTRSKMLASGTSTVMCPHGALLLWASRTHMAMRRKERKRAGGRMGGVFKCLTPFWRQPKPSGPCKQNFEHLLKGVLTNFRRPIVSRGTRRFRLLLTSASPVTYIR